VTRKLPRVVSIKEEKKPSGLFQEKRRLASSATSGGLTYIKAMTPGFDMAWQARGGSRKLNQEGGGRKGFRNRKAALTRDLTSTRKEVGGGWGGSRQIRRRKEQKGKK